MTFDSILVELTWCHIKAVTCLWALNRFPLAGSSVSNRPFAHCCQIFRERNFPLCFFLLLEKSEEIYLFFFVALICYKDIITKILVICQALFGFFKTTKLRLVNHYTTIKAYFSKFVKSFLQIFPVRFTTASVLTYFIYHLIIQAGHGR